MSKMIISGVLAAALAATAAVPVAEAGRYRHHNGYSHYNNHSNWRGHRGHGYWRNGKWIALGILGAAAAGAIADEDCYWRHGRRYCY